MQVLGIVGWRGMVGQVLLERMREEGDLKHYETVFFSTSSPGKEGPEAGSVLKDAYSIEELKKCDILLVCQGSDYTHQVLDDLNNSGWKGYWIDASSALRMQDRTQLILDPVNEAGIKQAITEGTRIFSGSNCTVSLLLMGIQGLISEGLVEWVSTMTYQAASGAGAKLIEEWMQQIQFSGRQLELNKDLPTLERAKSLTESLLSDPSQFQVGQTPLLASLIPFIDSALETGESKEEWKAMAEANKILKTQNPIPIDGTCVRVGAIRCHAQAVTLKLTRDIDLSEIESRLREANPWVEWVENTRPATVEKLNPLYFSGKLEIGVGRVKKMKMGPDYLGLFTIGDQLLWGAAEPLRRMLRYL